MDYITLSNRIKDLHNIDWLTESQKAIYDTIMTSLKTHELINIYGVPGTGKTFLGWNLVRDMKALYTSNIFDDIYSDIVVLDNWSNTRMEIRKILPIMEINKIKKVIFITEKKAKDDVVCLELIFSDKDKVKFKNNLWNEFNLTFESEKVNDTMHSLIKMNIR